jgi:hypothetical protein
MLTFLAPASRAASTSARTPDAAADRHRDLDRRGHPPENVKDRPPVFHGGGDIQKAQFIGARSLVGGGAGHRIAGINQVHEMDALDNPPSADVQTRHDMDGFFHG